jgi:hypothetical protein
MAEENDFIKRDKDADKENARPKKPPGYRNFEKLLKQVIKSPSMRHQKKSSDSVPEQVV